MASCRLITEPELYRLRNLRDIQARELKAGDFAGLVNLDTLTVAIQPLDAAELSALPPGVFTGSGIKHLVLRTPGAIQNGAFDGLRVESMSVSLGAGGPVYDRHGEETGYLPPGRLPESLPESLRWLRISGDLRELDWDVFQALPELEYLSLLHDQGRPEGTPTPTVMALPSDAFDGNPKLKALELRRNASWPVGAFHLPVSLLSGHEHLSMLMVDKLHISGREPDGLPLQVHPDSPAAEWVAQEGLREWRDWEDGQEFWLRTYTFPNP